MEHIRSRLGKVERATTGVSRDALALALDGAVPATDLTAEAAYRAAFSPLSSVMDRPIQRLRDLSAAGLVAASARFDNTHRLLDALGVTPISTCAIPEDRSWPGILVVGCIGATHVEQNRWFERMLERGAVIVSSDRSAAVPVLTGGLSVAARRPGCRARVAVRPDLADGLESGAEWGRLVSEMHPAVRLSAGHLPLNREQHCHAKILADDVLTDEPLAILATIGGGQVLHSVAHWWQDTPADPTEMGRRPLASVPAFAMLGHEHPDARFGWFGAASVMMTVLLAGLDAALDRVAWQFPATGSAASTNSE
jgi:hypothetical protein